MILLALHAFRFEQSDSGSVGPGMYKRLNNKGGAEAQRLSSQLEGREFDRNTLILQVMGAGGLEPPIF